MEAFPDAKVLLTVRNPSTWYDSVHNSIYQIHEARRQSWTVRAYQWLIGMGETCETIDEIARHSPKGFEKGNVCRVQNEAYSFWKYHKMF